MPRSMAIEYAATHPAVSALVLVDTFAATAGSYIAPFIQAQAGLYRPELYFE